jgi:hypothetical protein
MANVHADFPSADIVQVITVRIIPTCLLPGKATLPIAIPRKANSVKTEGAKPWVLLQLYCRDRQVTEVSILLPL